MKKITSTIDFLTQLNFISFDENNKVIAPESIYISQQAGATYTRIPLSSFFLNMTKDELEEKIKRLHENGALKQLRISLSHHLEGQTSLSYSTFVSTNLLALVDIDVNLSEFEILELVENLKYKPTYVHKTYKGWHLLWFGNFLWGKNEEVLYSSIEKVLGKQPQILKLKDRIKKVEFKSSVLAETRFITEDLYAIQTGDFYEKSFIDEITKEETKIQYIELHDLSLQDVSRVLTICPVMRQIDEIWDIHSYNEWQLMAYYYALKHILGDDEAIDEFLQKSMRYDNFDYDEAKRLIEQQIQWINDTYQNREGFLYGCNAIQERASNVDLTICETCQLKPNPFIYSKLKFSTLPPKFIEKDFVIYYEEVKEKEESVNTSLIPVVKKFEIGDVFKIRNGSLVKYIMKITNDRKETEFFEIEYTANAIVDISEIYPFLTPLDPANKKIKHLLSILIDGIRLNYQANNGLKTLTSVGYDCYYNYRLRRFENNITIANKSGFTEKDLQFLFFGLYSNRIKTPVPSIEGKKETWLNSYKILHKLKDPLLTTLIGVSLMTFNQSYFETVFKFNPIVIIHALRGSGKTLRMLLTQAVFGVPAVNNYTSLTIARLQNYFGMYKIPLFFDEVIVKQNEKTKVEDFRRVLYAVANMDSKQDATKTVSPITTPSVFAGETANISVDSFYEGGLRRRVLVLDINKFAYKHNIEVMRKVLVDNLRANYGHIFYYFYNFQNEKILNRVFDYYENKLSNISVEEEYEDLFNLVKIILINYKIFSEYVLQETFDYEDDVIDYLLSNLKTRNIDENKYFEDDPFFIVKSIQEKVMDAFKKSRVQLYSKTISNILSNADITLASFEEDKKKLWSLFTFTFRQVKKAYFPNSYSVNLLEFVFDDTQRPFSVVLEHELHRMQSVIKALHSEKYKHLFEMFKTAYLNMLSEFANIEIYKKPAIDFAEKLINLGFLTEKDIEDLRKSTENKQDIIKTQEEAVEF